MGFRSWLGLGGSKPAARMTSDQSQASFSTLDWDSFPWWQQGSATAAGLRVSKEEALAVPAVLRGRNLICTTVSSMPLYVVDPDFNPQTNSLLEQIDPDVANIVTLAQTVEDLLFEAIAWWRVTARGYDRYPTSAQHVDVRNVSWQIPAEYPLNRLPSGYYPGSHVFLVNSLEAVPVRDMIRFDSPNPALLVHAARAIRRALKLEQAADRYADSPQAREFFTAVDGADPDDAPDDDGLTEVEKMLNAWEAARRLRATGYVPSGFLHNKIDQLTPVELQLATLIEKATVAIANAIGIDPEDLGVSTTSRTYKNDVDHRQDLINNCYGGYAQAITERLSMGDITKRGQTVCLDWDGFLKANPTDRATIQQIYLENQVKTRDEIRGEERKPPLTAAQKASFGPPALPAPGKPAAIDIPAPGQPAQPLASVTPIRPGAQTYDDRASAVVFAADGPGLVFDTSGVPGSFQVNEAKRTITGLVMPWNQVGRSGGKRWKFAPDALQYDPAQTSRMKLIFDHDHSASVGRVIQTWSDARGQWARYKVARGAAGDRALAEAADGAKDGLSAGVGYEGADHGMTFGADPDGATDVIYVTKAPWRETSLVAIPAFDDARVSAVTMSADSTLKGDPMHCSLCGQEHAPGIACPQAPAPVVTPPATTVATYTAAQVAAAFAARPAPVAVLDPPPAMPAIDLNAILAGPIEAAVNAAFAKFEADHAGPTFVNPARPGEVAQVTEKPLYRFDGNPAQRCFTADIASGAFEKDSTLRGQAEEFLADRMKAAFANITVSNVTTMNPTIQRPDLWVPDLFFARPIGGMMQGGVVDSITKQTLPKFSSASGMASDHTEGTEPSQGTFTTTSQDITPRAISGRVDIDREVIDQGGTPQTDQVIWNEMTGYYAKRLEIRAAAVFTALALSDTAVVGTDGDLQTSILNTFADLQFLAGGDRYRGLALNSDLYKALLTAKDEAGRLLFPALGVTNAAGTASSDLSRIVVSTKVGLPAWALIAGNGGPGKSFMFVPESCYQWFSPPRRFDLTGVNVSSVGIGIWGYSAEFITRNSDVMQLGYSIS